MNPARIVCLVKVETTLCGVTFDPCPGQGFRLANRLISSLQSPTTWTSVLGIAPAEVYPRPITPSPATASHDPLESFSRIARRVMEIPPHKDNFFGGRLGWSSAAQFRKYFYKLRRVTRKTFMNTASMIWWHSATLIPTFYDEFIKALFADGGKEVLLALLEPHATFSSICCVSITSASITSF